MKHLGDITQIDGYKVPIVDCVIGGSPCQDLSIAGLRAGLKGVRSGLYMEQLRIVKEMREHDKRNGRSGVDVRPRFMVWENVPGSFSSNKGEDFRIVLEELAKIADEDAVVPMPEKSKWTTSGCIVGDGWSIAWRVLDAQFWGVPQRRRRIALVADFGGESAAEILFVRQSLYGNIEQGKSKRQNSSTDTAKGIGDDDKPYTMIVRNGCEGGGKGALVQTDISATLNTTRDQTLFQPVYSVENHPADSRVDIDESGKVQTLTTRMGTGGGNVPMVMETFSKTHRASSKDDNETWKESGTANTLNTFDQGDTRATDVVVAFDGYNGAVDNVQPSLGVNCGMSTGRNGVVALDRASYNQGVNAKFDIGIDENGIAHSLVAKGPSAVCYGFDPNATRDIGQYFLENMGNTLVNGSCPGHHNGVCIASVDCRNFTENSDVNGTLQAKDSGGTSLNLNNVVRTNYIVRRLTPLECERLQGYPDNWTLIGEPVEENVADYITKFDESKYIKPNYEDFGLSWDDMNEYSQLDEEDIDDNRYLAYQKALNSAWTKATKKIKVGSHKETHYYYTNSKGKKVRCSDSARYKALGNSIALPPWKWVLKKLCACYERNATMASLFDGIGGFPYLWEQINGKGTCLWASEIEEFPMAVTKKRLGGD